MQPPQSSWFVYKPANDAQHRPHGHFMLSPGEQQVYNGQMQYHPGMQYPNQYMHQTLHQHQQPLQPKPVYHGNMAMTPIASPQPQHMKASAAIKQDTSLRPLDTSVYHRGNVYSPCTPPLSTSTSAMSSPPSSSMALSTPLNGQYFGFQPYESVKEGREADVYGETFANADWSRTGSPPMTPGKWMQTGDREKSDRNNLSHCGCIIINDGWLTLVLRGFSVHPACGNGQWCGCYQPCGSPRFVPCRHFVSLAFSLSISHPKLNTTTTINQRI